MARKENRYHFIYKTTNVLTNRYYYGMHSTNNINDDYLGSGRRLKYSINKYGKENHQREIIEYCPDRSSLKQREIEIVNINEIAKHECMNLIEGGTGGFTVEQQKKNARKSNKIQHKLHKNKDWVEKKGNRISIKLKKAYVEGRREKKFHYDWNGRKHREESKEKIGKANSVNHLGEQNSQFGTCWITNGMENKKIKKNDLIPDDWRLGRIM